MCFSSFIQDVHSSTRSAYGPSEIKGRSLALIDLERITHGLIKDSLAPSSRLAYDSAQSAYSRFCSMLGLQSYPASEDVLVDIESNWPGTTDYSNKYEQLLLWAACCLGFFRGQANSPYHRDNILIQSYISHPRTFRWIIY